MKYIYIISETKDGKIKSGKPLLVTTSRKRLARKLKEFVDEGIAEMRNGKMFSHLLSARLPPVLLSLEMSSVLDGVSVEAYRD